MGEAASEKQAGTQTETTVKTPDGTEVKTGEKPAQAPSQDRPGEK